MESSSTPGILEDDEFIPRALWGPREPGYPFRLVPPASYVFVGYVRKSYLGPQTKTSPGPEPGQEECGKELCYILRGEYNKRLPDIRFNFMVCGGKTADVWEGRGWTRQPTLPLKYQQLNPRSFYIGIIGDYREKDPGKNIHEKVDKIIEYAVHNKHLQKQFTRVDLANPFKKKPDLKPTQNYISSSSRLN